MTSFGIQQSRKLKPGASSSSSNENSSQSKSSKESNKANPPPLSVWREVIVPFFLDKTRVLQSKHKMTSQDASTGVQFAPLRPLDDFILGSARFQLPNFSDFEKWGNRVVKNLCYYQTNYLIVLGVWLVLTLVYQPKVAIYSTGIIFASLFAAKYCIQMYGSSAGGRENIKYLLATLGTGLVLMYLMDLIIFVLFVVLVPFCSE